MSNETLHAVLRYRNGRSALIEISDVHEALDVPDDAFPPDFTLSCEVDDESLDGSLRFERASELMKGKVLFDQRVTDSQQPTREAG